MKKLRQHLALPTIITSKLSAVDKNDAGPLRGFGDTKTKLKKMKLHEI